ADRRRPCSSITTWTSASAPRSRRATTSRYMASTCGTIRADSSTSHITTPLTRTRTGGSSSRPFATARSSSAVFQHGGDDQGHLQQEAFDPDQPESQLGALEPRGDREKQTQRD